MTISKQDVLNNLDEVKKYIEEAENKKEEKVIGIAIKNRWTGEIIFQSTKKTYKEAIIEKGDVYLCDADLRNAYLRNADLRDTDLRNADLRDTDLRNADLRDTDLSGANLCGANLYGANLYGANLYGANLYGADLCGAELNCAKFYGRGGSIKIKKANLEGFLGALGFVLEE